MPITPGAVRNMEIMFGAFSNRAMSVVLSSKSNRQPVKPDGAVPSRDARIVGWPCSFSSLGDRASYFASASQEDDGWFG
jgi:hypothetical protein